MHPFRFRCTKRLINQLSINKIRNKKHESQIIIKDFSEDNTLFLTPSKYPKRTHIVIRR